MNDEKALLVRHATNAVEALALRGVWEEHEVYHEAHAALELALGDALGALPAHKLRAVNEALGAYTRATAPRPEERAAS